MPKRANMTDAHLTPKYIGDEVTRVIKRGKRSQKELCKDFNNSKYIREIAERGGRGKVDESFISRVKRGDFKHVNDHVKALCRYLRVGYECKVEKKKIRKADQGLLSQKNELLKTLDAIPEKNLSDVQQVVDALLNISSNGRKKR